MKISLEIQFHSGDAIEESIDAGTLVEQIGGARLVDVRVRGKELVLDFEPDTFSQHDPDLAGYSVGVSSTGGS